MLRKYKPWHLSCVMCHLSFVPCHLSPVTYQMSYGMYHISPVTYHQHQQPQPHTLPLLTRPLCPQNPKMVELLTSNPVYVTNQITWFMSHVTCHLSPVTCHLSPITCHMSPQWWVQNIQIFEHSNKMALNIICIRIRGIYPVQIYLDIH